MVNENYFGVNNFLDHDNSMEIDQSEELINNTSSQSDSKLYESNKKKSDTRHSFSETITKRKPRSREENKYKERESIESNQDTLNKKCIEKSSDDTQLQYPINNESGREPVRAESMIRQTITKMEKNHAVTPGMASARSLTNLISADYGWTSSAVYSKVEKALNSAVDQGIIKEMINKQNGQKSYTVPDAKVKKYIKAVCKQPENSKTYFYNEFSDLMSNES